MGSQRPAERVVRCDSIGLGCLASVLLPITSVVFRPTVISAKKLELVDVVVLRISPKGFFDRRIS
jgi:hypothetical protein